MPETIKNVIVLVLSKTDCSVKADALFYPHLYLDGKLHNHLGVHFLFPLIKANHQKVGLIQTYQLYRSTRVKCTRK